MVFVNVHRTGMTAATIAARLRQAGSAVHSLALSPALRHHLDVHTEDIGRAVRRHVQCWVEIHAC